MKRTFLAAALPILLVAGSARAGTVSGRVVDKEGKGIAEAVVFVQAPEQGAAQGTHRATMDQVNKTFVPGVLRIEAGTEVRFPNHDQIHHHVYSFSRTKNFELPLYKGQDAAPVLFDKPGVVKVGCNIHDWMSAVILVLPNSHYVVTDAEGRFTLDELPQGNYTLEAWHERSRDKQDGVSSSSAVALDDARATARADFVLSLAPVRARPAMRGLRSNQ